MDETRPWEENVRMVGRKQLFWSLMVPEAVNSVAVAVLPISAQCTGNTRRKHQPAVGPTRASMMVLWQRGCLIGSDVCMEALFAFRVLKVCGKCE